MSVARELANLPSASPSTDANFDNGTFVIDISADNVGIGTTAPAMSTTTVGSTLTALTVYESTANSPSVLELGGTTTADDTRLGGVQFINGANSGADAASNKAIALIESRSEGTGGTNDGGEIAFLTKADAGSLTEKMRITDSGQIGIGTSVPQSFTPSLDLYGTQPAIILQDSATVVDFLNIMVDNDRVELAFDDHSYLGFGTATNAGRSGYSEKMRITSAGNVGIGTTAPVTNLTVDGTLTLKERAEADTNTATYGQLWVNTASPNELYFTADDDTDIQLTTATGINAASTGKAIAMAMVFGG